VCYGKFDSCCCCCLFLMFYRRFICLSIVFCICFKVLFMLSGGVYFARSAYFFWASRAFSIYTWRASMSSAVSTLNSSSYGSTVMVTDFATVSYFVSGLCSGGIVSCTSVLDDGMSLDCSTFTRSITLWSGIVGGCYGD
jgi:hypothetical protein